MPPSIGRASRIFAFACALGVVACGGEGVAPAPSASSAAPAPIPARPDDLAAHVVIAAPRTTLPALRSGFPDAAAALPGSFASIVTTIADLPITVAELVDDDAPVTATVLASKEGVEAVVAIHVRSIDRVVSLATAGESARYRSVAGQGGLTRLEAVHPRDAAPRVAALGNHLLIATSDAALDRAGAFTERAPPPALREGELVAIEHGAAAPLLALNLATRWLNPPRAPSRFGPYDTIPNLGYELLKRIAPAFDALAGGRTSLRIESSRLRVDVAMGDSLLTRLGTAGLAASEPASFLAFPRDAAVAALFHAGGPDAEAVTLSSELTGLTGIQDARRDAVAAAMTKLERTRAPALTIGGGVSPAGPTLWFRTPLVDRAGASEALEALVAAIGTKAKDERPSVTARETVIERVGDVVRLRVRSEGPADAPPVDVILRHEGDLLLGATGADASGAIEALQRGSAETRLGAEPIAVALAESAPRHHAIALIDLAGVDALARGKQRAATRVFAGVSAAQRDGVPSLRILVEPAALAALREKLAPPRR